MKNRALEVCNCDLELHHGWLAQPDDMRASSSAPKTLVLKAPALDQWIAGSSPALCGPSLGGSGDQDHFVYKALHCRFLFRRMAI